MRIRMKIIWNHNHNHNDNKDNTIMIMMNNERIIKICTREEKSNLAPWEIRVSAISIYSYAHASCNGEGYFFNYN